MHRASCSPHAVKDRRAEKVLKTVPFVRIDPSEETDAPLVRFPQSEAPVLMGMITRKPALAQARRRQVPLRPTERRRSSARAFKTLRLLAGFQKAKAVPVWR